MTTMARRVAAVLHDDGQTWTAEDGRDLREVALDHGLLATTICHDTNTVRLHFADGSAIVETEAWWHVEGDEPM